MRSFVLLAALLGVGGPLLAQGYSPGNSLGQPPGGVTVLRGQVRIELEPVFALHTDVPVPYPLDSDTARRRALEEASVCFAAMIYGWSFDYEIGERARGIPEEMELTPLGEVAWGDSRLMVTDAQVEDLRFTLWADYRPSEDQIRRLGMWRAGLVRSVQARGYGPLGGPVDSADWHSITKAALEDAARAGVRAMLRGSERNRPKEARGFIALTEFPLYRMDGGRWTASARFRVQITEIIPFAAY